MDILSRRRKGMELPINTVVILVVLLVLVLVVLILVSRASYNFSDVGEEKIDVARSVTNCQILCWDCCRIDTTERCNDPLYHSDTIGCNCIC